MTNTNSLEKLRAELDNFVAEREWRQFHAPKNLAMALSVEVAELVEIFQWLTPKESASAEVVDLVHLEEEIGDVMIYLTTLAGAFSLDPIAAALKKVEKNKRKYPADQVRGRTGQGGIPGATASRPVKGAS